MIRLLAMLSLFSLLGACKVNERDQNDEKYIVCTTSIIQNCVKEIVGEGYKVDALMGAGVDPHSYKPRPADVHMLNTAEVIVYNGVHLEGKMVELFHQLSERKTSVAVAANFPKSQFFLTSKQGAIDPHIWFDTEDWSVGLRGVVAVLKEKYPQDSSLFEANLDRFLKRISIVTVQLKSEMLKVPREQRVLITSHDAFHYFGRTFGIKVKALQGISTTQEPGVRDVVDLVDFIVKHKVKSIFIENSVSPKAIKTVIESCKKRGQEVHIGGTLFSDALGDKTTEGNTYLGMLQHNVRTIIKGLRNE